MGYGLMEAFRTRILAAGAYTIGLFRVSFSFFTVVRVSSRGVCFFRGLYQSYTLIMAALFGFSYIFRLSILFRARL